MNLTKHLISAALLIATTGLAIATPEPNGSTQGDRASNQHALTRHEALAKFSEAHAKSTAEMMDLIAKFKAAKTDTERKAVLAEMHAHRAKHSQIGQQLKADLEKVHQQEAAGQQ